MLQHPQLAVAFSAADLSSIAGHQVVRVADLVLLADIPSARPAVLRRHPANSLAALAPSIPLARPLAGSQALAVPVRVPALVLVPALVRPAPVVSVALAPVRADLHPQAKRRVRSALPLEAEVDVHSTRRPKKAP